MLTLSYAGMTQIRFKECFSATRPGGTSSGPDYDGLTQKPVRQMAHWRCTDRSGPFCVDCLTRNWALGREIWRKLAPLGRWAAGPLGRCPLFDPNSRQAPGLVAVHYFRANCITSVNAWVLGFWVSQGFKQTYLDQFGRTDKRNALLQTACEAGQTSVLQRRCAPKNVGPDRESYY